MAQPVTCSSIRQYIGYLQQQMIYPVATHDIVKKPAYVEPLKQRRDDLEIFFSRQLRRLS
ncbi:MAG: hypothetical protein HC879_19340 [Leptolyngbyaceae cyanobacterium SL_5_9]|nr:hypothetical protein [Leptolyngbyaceae cyanobacterium SL_5_9]NJO75095.1 hypothetical protein [Leptolyngbyaceae cyanobacterium RM1_406_9]